jgi:hypothetical protein
LASPSGRSASDPQARDNLEMLVKIADGRPVNQK